MRSTKIQLVLALVLACHPALSFGGLMDFNLREGLSEKVKRGNEAYGRKDWDEALKHYSDGLVDRPESEVLQANVGSVLYQQGKFDEAQKAFEKLASSSDRKLRARAHYDLGNALYRRFGHLAESTSSPSPSSSSPSPPSPPGSDPSQLLQRSLESYIECLKLDPSDEDAKFNVEFIRRKIKEQQKQEKQDPQKQDQEKQDQQKQDQEKQDQEKQDQQNQDQRKQDQEKQDPQKQDEKEKQKQDQQKQQQKQDEQGAQDPSEKKPERETQPEDDQAIPREQALKKLDDLREHEKRELERQMQRRAGQRGSVRYDW